MAEEEKRRQEKLSEQDLGKVQGGRRLPLDEDDDLNANVGDGDESGAMDVSRMPYRGGTKKHG